MKLAIVLAALTVLVSVHGAAVSKTSKLYLTVESGKFATPISARLKVYAVKQTNPIKLPVTSWDQFSGHNLYSSSSPARPRTPHPLWSGESHTIYYSDDSQIAIEIWDATNWSHQVYVGGWTSTIGELKKRPEESSLVLNSRGDTLQVRWVAL